MTNLENIEQIFFGHSAVQYPKTLTIEEISEGKARTNTRKLIRNILNKLPCICVCLSSGDLFNFPFPYFV